MDHYTKLKTCKMTFWEAVEFVTLIVEKMKWEEDPSRHERIENVLDLMPDEM